MGSISSTDGKVLGSDEGTNLVAPGGKLLGTILENIVGIKLEMDFRTDMGSLDGSFDSYNDGKLYCLFLGGSLRSTGGKVPVSDEGNQVWCNYCKLFGNMLRDVDVITVGIDVVTDLVSF